MSDRYRTQSPDSSPEAEQILLEAYRRMLPCEKAQRVSALTRSCLDLARAGIRQRLPDAAEEEIRLRLASLWLDRETMIAVFHWDPREKGYG